MKTLAAIIFAIGGLIVSYQLITQATIPSDSPLVVSVRCSGRQEQGTGR